METNKRRIVENMNIRTNTWNRVAKSLAKMQAAFPAGDYHFNAYQNIAMNALNDALASLRREVPELDQACLIESRKHHEWQIHELVRLGIIDKKLAIEELNHTKGLYATGKSKAKKGHRA